MGLLLVPSKGRLSMGAVVSECVVQAALQDGGPWIELARRRRKPREPMKSCYAT